MKYPKNWIKFVLNTRAASNQIDFVLLCSGNLDTFSDQFMKRLLTSLLILIAIILLAIFLYFQFSSCGIAPWSCGDYQTSKEIESERIIVGDGPEDMAVDTTTGVSRIIVSCTNRRVTKQQVGSFYQINLDDHSSSQLTIIPKDLRVFPHGIDIVTIDGLPYLYAISHQELENDTKHKIFRFLISGDTLIQDQDFVLEHSIMTGPNDIDVLDDGSFYVSNPMPSNDPMESTKAILGFKNGTVIHYDGNGSWQTVLEDMCYPNGVWFNESTGQLVVANGGCKAVERFQIEDGKVVKNSKLSTAKSDIDIPIGDNLMMDNQGMLWTAAHPCPIKFLEHIETSENKSPMQIFAIDPMTMKTQLVVQNNGDLISAASTALRIDNRLYVSQVFDPFVLVIDDLNF